MDCDIATGRGLLHLDCVLPRSGARTPREAFAQAARALEAAHGIDAAALVERLCLRESRGATTLGDGLALPHADAWGITRPYAAFVRIAHGVAFPHAKDDILVRDMFVLVAPRPATAIHGAMLSYYRALLGEPGFRELLGAAATREALWRHFREREWSREPRTLPGAKARAPRLRGRRTGEAARATTGA